jgi:hypothetical protein
MDEVDTVRLHKVREATGTADARHSRDLLLPELALFDQLEIKRQDREITAPRTPGGMVGGHFLFGQRFPLGLGHWNRGYIASTNGGVSQGSTHIQLSVNYGIDHG